MRVFNSFLVVFVSVILMTLPITTSIYNFRTDVRDDTFPDVVTAVGQTAANITLLKDIYDDDTATIEFISSISEVPVYSSYNATTRQLTVSGLTADTTRDLTVSYDIDALTDSSALGNILDRVPMIVLLIIIALPIAAIAAVFTGKA